MNIVSKRSTSKGRERIQLINRLNISDASALFDVLVLVFFFLSVYLTPIFKKAKPVAVLVMLTLILLFVARYILAMNARPLIKKSQNVFLWVQLLLTFFWSMTWGVYNAYVLGTMALGWTSYFLTVSTLAIAAAYVLLHATSFVLMILTLVTMIWPSMLVNAIYIPGLRGFATTMLLFMFWVLLIILGIQHNKKVIEVLLQRSRMAAILEAIPGTICWFDTQRKLLGGNSNFFDVFAGKNRDIQTLEDQSVDKTIAELAAGVIDSKQAKVNGSKQVGDRSYYIVGQKYQFGDEALLVGIDISTQESLNQELEQERLRSYEIGKIAEINELLRLLIHEEKSNVSTLKALSSLGTEEDKYPIWKRIHTIHQAIEAVTDEELYKKSEPVGLNDLTEMIEATFSSYLMENEIAFFIRGVDDMSVRAHSGALLLCFSILIHNAVDALKKSDEPAKKIQIKMVKEDGRIHFYVEDNGPGIDEIYAEMIFEPYISSQNGSGLGLAIMNEIIYSYGGTTGVSRLAKPTRFFIDLPLIESNS